MLSTYHIIVNVYIALIIQPTDCLSSDSKLKLAAILVINIFLNYFLGGKGWNGLLPRGFSILHGLCSCEIPICTP